MDTGIENQTGQPAAAQASSRSPSQPASPPPSAKRRRRRWPWVLGGCVVLIGGAVAVFDWNWFKPIVEARASAALGRTVTMQRFHVALGRVPHITLDGVRIANPANWPGGGDFATIDRLAVDVDAMAYLRQREIVIPLVSVEHPVVDAAQSADGKTATWDLNLGAPTGETAATQPAAQSGPKIGILRITDGNVHVVVPKLAADFNLAVRTKEEEGRDAQVLVDAKGTYARQPITGQFIGGALLSLRDASKPYPVDLKAANGPTRISLQGTIQDPLNLAGADLKLELSGPDMALLLPLTGVPIPQTPPYRVAGNLDYAERKIRFRNFTGQVGSSDLAGTIAVDPTGERPVVDADLHSRLVDLDDLAGFIGGTPGRTSTPGQTPQQRRAVAQAESDGKLLPNTPINMPKLTAADVHLSYKGDKLRGQSQPLDNIVAKLDIVNGAIRLHPLSFAVGRGQIRSEIALNPVPNNALHMRADVAFERVDVSRFLRASGVGNGSGVIGGRAVVDGQGRSLAQLLGTGNGEIKLFMRGGGSVSALLVDLAGLHIGNAVLSALGVPDRAVIQCMAANAVLRGGVLTAQTFLLDTDQARVTVGGQANLANETLALKLRSEAKHFTVGSLNTPIDIGGTLQSPSIRPELGEAGARVGAAVGLGVLLTPVAGLLATVEFGTGEDNACATLVQQAATPPTVPAARTARPARGRAAPARRRQTRR